MTAATLRLALVGAPNSGKIGLTTATSLASNFGIRVYLIALQPKLELAPGERAPESPLAKLTFRTGGKFFEADRPETLALALKEIAELEVYRGPEGDEAFWQERFQWALLIALAFLVLEFCFAKTFLRVLPA